ncbi:hypothetical protein BH09PAT2_BH09PAT2_06710 [soil metagenome]
MKQRVVIFLLFFIGFFFIPFAVHAQEARIEAKIIKLQHKNITIEVTEGKLQGKTYPVALFDDKQIGVQQLSVGDNVIISFMTSPQGQQAIIVDHVRRLPLMILAGLFIIIVLVVGKKKGILSLVSMIISFLIIGRLILPQILIGNDPVIISLIGAIFIIPTLFYVSHGFNWKTSIAVVSTFLSLIVTGILAVAFVHLAQLTGYAAEEATFIQATGHNIDIRSLLLAGIIIGAMGVLDDITISQTSIVEKLIKANPKYKGAELFREAMDVGRDHIASLVNTLVLVYAGAALPLFVLFYSSAFKFNEVINMELVATEIVRTLVSSIGIVLAVPITTIIAVWYADKLRAKH